MPIFLKGVEKHLHSPNEKLRIIGMIVGECLMNYLNKLEDNSKKLKFDVNNRYYLI